MMLFYDLDVESRLCKLRSGLRDQSLDQIHADRHVSGFEHRYLFCRVVERFSLLLRESCGAYDHRKVLPGAVGKKSVNSGSCGKINDYICFRAVIQIPVYRKSGIRVAKSVDACNYLCLFILFTYFCDDMSHSAAAAVDDDPDHFFSP